MVAIEGSLLAVQYAPFATQSTAIEIRDIHLTAASPGLPQ